MLNSEKVGLVRSQVLINHYDGQCLGCIQVQSDRITKQNRLTQLVFCILLFDKHFCRTMIVESSSKIWHHLSMHHPPCAGEDEKTVTIISISSNVKERVRWARKLSSTNFLANQIHPSFYQSGNHFSEPPMKDFFAYLNGYPYIQVATVRTGHGTADWFQIGKGVHQACILSPCLFNLYAEYIMRNAGMDKARCNQDCQEKYQ